MALTFRELPPIDADAGWAVKGGAVRVKSSGGGVLAKGHGERPAMGYSLVECLLVNALALALVAALFAATADLIAAARASSALSDQAMRARQVIHFIEQLLVPARMPAEWLNGKATTGASPVWHTPSPICEPPETISSAPRWGGVDVIEMDVEDLPCVAAGDAEWGLYIEQIRVCPHDCGVEAGYVIRPTPCLGTIPVINREMQWRVQWQGNMGRPADCDTGWPWGRLQRILLTDRSGEAGIEGIPTLRMQSVSRKPTYQWQRAETLVAGIARWQPKMISAWVSRNMADGVAEVALQLLSVGLTVLPDHGAQGPKDLHVSRLLLPPSVLPHE